MTYWLDLFTGTTWDEFRNAGARLTGFRSSRRNIGQRVQPGDVFLCYLTGVMRWVGALEVLRPSKDTARVWKDEEFPVRFDVKPLVMLDAECGVPMEMLKGRVEFYESEKERGKFKGFLRSSPTPFKRLEDAELVLSLMREAEQNPVRRAVDPKKLSRKPLYPTESRLGKKKVATLVTVPDDDESEDEPTARPEVKLETLPEATLHTEIQYHLLSLGAEMGLEVWCARNDRSRAWKGQRLGDLPGMVSEMPTQFNEATTKTIELIDVLWLKGNSIHAAFEVECTTSVYSGLLRMSDLLALQPNLDIRLFIVAPDERRAKVEQEILRPTFKLREKPLFEVCGFLPFSTLKEKVDGIRRLGLASSLRPEFLEKTAEYFNDSSTQD